MKIIFFEVPKKEEELFLEAFKGEDVSFYEETLSEDNVSLAKDADIISVFVNSKVGENIIKLLPNLKFINTRSTGFDHINADFCKTKGIVACNVPSYGSHTVAEFAFALLLTVSRKIFTAYDNLRDGADFSIFNLQGFDLNGKTIGIIGTGKIGRNMMKIAQGFNMKILAYDLYPDETFAKENNFSYTTLEELIKNSDVITLHAPYNADSHHLINKERISMMKRGVVLINTARGELIDTSALIWGLKEGIIKGAGLDVLEGERDLREEAKILSSKEKSDRVKDYKILLEDHVLIDMPNVVVTPHVAFYSKEAEDEIIKVAIQDIKDFISGNPVNLIK